MSPCVLPCRAVPYCVPLAGHRLTCPLLYLKPYRVASVTCRREGDMRRAPVFKQHDLFKSTPNVAVKLPSHARAGIVRLLCDLLCELREASARISDKKREENHDE
jgi:hypothetical protein